MSDLNQAISIATKVHAGQLDKAGQPYILHPLRLMLKFQAEDEMIVAVLHDVVEDSDVSIKELEELGFASSILEAISSLTKNVGEDYDSFISRVSENKLATKVKIEDIKDNLDLTRLVNISSKDLERVEKYHRSLRKLQNGE